MNNSLSGSYFPKTDVVVLFSSAFGCGLGYRYYHNYSFSCPLLARNSSLIAIQYSLEITFLPLGIHRGYPSF